MARLARQSLVDQLSDQLLDLIVERRLTDGDPLPSTASLAEEFGVSAVVVREAIALLVGRGVVSRQQGREAVVRRPGPEVIDSLFRVRASQDAITLEEIQQCRAALELQSAALAATAPDAAHRASALDGALDQLRRSATVADVVAADQAFHRAVAELSRNRPLALMLASLTSLVRETIHENWQRVMAEQDDWLAFALARHEAIARAIAAGDRRAAIRAMAEHFLTWEPEVDYGELDVLNAGAEPPAAERQPA